MQQGMLFHRTKGGAPGVDVEQVICELRERVQPSRLEQAWREVVTRHAALRTRFEWTDGETPRQVVHDAAEVQLNFLHANFDSAAEARAGLEAYLTTDRAAGFAALTPPLLRVALLRDGPEHFWLVVTYHHLVLDARSMTVMFREALEFYDGFVTGRSLSLPPAQPYRGYIDWLQTRDLKLAEVFWREHLRGFSAPTALPLAHNVLPALPPAPAGELAFRLSETITLALRATAQKYDVTPNTIAQAAWAIVLSRHTGEDEVVFGALRACRKIPQLDTSAIVGLFINTVPLRVPARAELPLGKWLQELRAQWVALRDHEHTPLVNVQQWSGVAPGQPLFETLFSFQEPSWDSALQALDDVWARRDFEIRAQPGYPLALEVLAGPTLTVKFIFERARFADEAVAQLMGHYRVVLEALAADVSATVGELPILTAPEERRLRVEWNRTAAEFPRNRCVHTFVEALAESEPERIAIVDAAGSLTFGQLNARANQLAHRLKTRGVGPDALVAVCMERSTEMIIAWLGTLKAGGAFVPLDPAYPKDRLAFQLADCRARVLVTQPHLRSALPELAMGMLVLELGADSGDCETEPAFNLPLEVTSRHLAYVIYTSGSTGQPKGVEIEHRALMNLVTWHQQRYAVTAADRATHLASPAFDAAIWEIWPYLAAGASVHIPDDDTRLSPALLWRWIAEQKITLSFMPTPLAEAAMNEPCPAGLALRALLTGGDQLKRRPADDFPCVLVNHYGPTESTVVTTSIPVSTGKSDALPAIGMPISNTMVRVLDRHLRFVPAGVAGELFIGGESLARGYLRRPELTAEKFIADPFAETPDSKPQTPNPARSVLYRTGDLVRWTVSGQIEFLGRIDGQVKIRGCRIELGEIEATLLSHPSVRGSLVLARVDEREQPQLVAYVLLRPDAPAGAEVELGAFLRGKLPAFMVPSTIMLLEAWPLTPNGKVDRAALPAPDMRGIPSSEPATPLSELERTVARVWADVLERESVARDDNFFELGGHSLLAAQVVARLNVALPGSISVRLLFDQPTLADFAREVECGLKNTPPAREPIARVTRRAVAR